MTRGTQIAQMGLGALWMCAPTLAAEFCGNGSTSIPDGGSASRAIVVEESSRVITNISVTVSLTHPWVGDVKLVLVHPNGTQVVLVDQPGIPSVGFPGPWGCGGADIAATFSDGASIEAETTCSTTATPVLSGALKPAQALSALNGLPTQGTWTLIASDLATFDVGTLGDVCLDITMKSTCAEDIDGNGAVDAGDLAIMLGAWGECAACAADLDDDNDVDGADLAQLLGAWGRCR